MIWISLEEGHYSIIQEFDHIALIKMKVLLAKGKEKMSSGMTPKSVCQILQTNVILTHAVLFFSYRKADGDGYMRD